MLEKRSADSSTRWHALPYTVTPAQNLFWYKVNSILSIHDGDSLRLIASLGFMHITCEVIGRLYGIDTPELGQPGALEARDYLRSRLDPLPPATVIFSHGQDKYGRWLIEVWVGDERLNDTLIQLGLAVPYFGGNR